MRPVELVPVRSGLPRSPSTLADYVPRFLGWFALLRRRAPNTVVNYRRDLERFVEFCDLAGLTSPEQVSYREIELHMAWLQATRGASPRTVNRHVHALRSFFKYLDREGVVPRNPTDLVDSLPEPKRLPDYLPIKEQDAALRILAEDQSPLGRRNHALIATGLLTGLRCEELARLRLEHVDLETPRLRVVNGKGGKDRELPIVPRLQEILRHYIDEVRPRLLHLGYGRDILAFVAKHGPMVYPPLKRRLDNRAVAKWLLDLHRRELLYRDGFSRRYQYTLAPKGARLLAEGHSSPYLFVNASGTSSHRPDQPLTTKAVWQLVHCTLTPLVGRPVWPHLLRHSFGSRLRSRGADLALIQEAMGHESIVSTMIYAHISTPQRNAELARFLAEDKSTGTDVGEGRE